MIPLLNHCSYSQLEQLHLKVVLAHGRQGSIEALHILPKKSTLSVWKRIMTKGTVVDKGRVMDTRMAAKMYSRRTVNNKNIQRRKEFDSTRKGFTECQTQLVWPTGTFK